MGLMNIGATLKITGHEPKIHDCAIDHKNLNILRGKIKDWKPDFISISIILAEVKQTKRIMGVIREILPDGPVTFGGPWPSANPGESIKTFGMAMLLLVRENRHFPN
jgi:nitrogenase molybdenum-iron protein alpha/beta subunit